MRSIQALWLVYSKEYLEYICVDEMGNLVSPQYLTASFPKLLEKNGLRRIRFHDLRHSCASLLLANGVPMKQIQEWLRHSDFSTTANVYAHLDYTTNTVIHYHAIIRKALQSAVKKDILAKNPADNVERPQKSVFHGSFYSEDEMLTLFDAIAGDPLELCVKIAAYYGLRRSEVLGLRWDAIDFEKKTISISHKVIEANVDGKYVPIGEDVLKTKSSFRTLPLIPVVEGLLLAEKEKQTKNRKLFKSA